jgi:orotate phosphoribosyltransferase-like protein
MKTRDKAVTLSEPEVSMVEPELIRQARGLRGQGWGLRRIARELGLARNTVRRYLRGGKAAEVQIRPRAWRLDGESVNGGREARNPDVWSTD